MARCCMCGSEHNLKHCNLCGHTLCKECRRAYFWRGLEAVRTLLGQSRLFCGGVRHG